MSTAIALAPLPWQQAAWSRAGAMIDTDRLPHALMVAAAAGTGTRQFAGFSAG